MKIRTGLVSNSSSSSFLLIGAFLPQDTQIDSTTLYNILFGRDPELDADGYLTDEAEDRLINPNKEGLLYRYSEAKGTYAIGYSREIDAEELETISVSEILAIETRVEEFFKKLNLPTKDIKLHIYTDRT